MNQFDCSRARFDVATGAIGYLDSGYGCVVVSAHRFDVRRRTREDVMVITVTGVLDALTAPRLEEAIDNALRVPSVALIVDLSTLDMLSPEGMTVLLAGQRVAMAPKRFCVVADDTTAEQPMTAIGLNRELTPYRSLSAALTDLD